jgi:aminoglycoside/choline kinase family phosphotransferase
MNDFEIHSIIRNLKIIGIFTRLSIRDKKHEYLKLIPHAWKLLKNRLKNKNKFNKLRLLLNQL